MCHLCHPALLVSLYWILCSYVLFPCPWFLGYVWWLVCLVQCLVQMPDGKSPPIVLFQKSSDQCKFSSVFSLSMTLAQGGLSWICSYLYHEVNNRNENKETTAKSAAHINCDLLLRCFDFLKPHISEIRICFVCFVSHWSDFAIPLAFRDRMNTEN